MLIFFGFFFSFFSFLYSGEIVLKSEKVFSCEILAEDEEFVKVKYKEDIYKIPVSEILFINKEIEPKYDSYNITKVLMPDGNIIRGRIIAEDSTSITLENSEESIAIPKTSITKMERGTEDFAVIPEKFLFEKKIVKEYLNEAGLQFGMLKNTNQFYNQNDLFAEKVRNQYSAVFGGYYQPASLFFFSKIKTGLDFSYYFSGENLRNNYSIFSISYYYLKPFSLMKNFQYYIQFGPSIANVFEIREGEKYANFGSLGIYAETGFQNYFSNDYFLKYGFRFSKYFKDGTNYQTNGFVFSIGKRF